MKLKRISMYLVALLALFSSCRDEKLAEDVYRMPKDEKTEQLDYKLRVSLKGTLEEGERYFLILSSESLFDSKGKPLDAVEPGRYLLFEELSGRESGLLDLASYYPSTLFLNVAREIAGGGYELVTNSGSQEAYNVSIGSTTLELDLDATALEHVKKSEISLSLPEEYQGKRVFLVSVRKVGAFEDAIREGKSLEGLYSYELTATSNLEINTPTSPESYVAYLLEPNSEVAYLKRPLEVTTQPDEVYPLVFTLEEKKQINVTVRRGDEAYRGAEVYLIDAAVWETVVKEQVLRQHGSPEPGTYLAKAVATEGSASFSVYQTEGSRDYIVYVPKWNREYYDSFEIRSLQVSADTPSYEVLVEAAYEPENTGGATPREVTFSVSLNIPDGYQTSPWGAKIYFFPEMEDMNQLMNHMFYGTGPEGTVTQPYQPDTLNEITGTIDPGKEFVVAILVQQGWTMRPLYKKMLGSEIKGNTAEITLDTLF